MSRQERNFLLTERSALQRMIEATPEEEAIDRWSLGSRLASVNERLSQLPENLREPTRARITYRGRPVLGSDGILAEFGAEVTQLFSKAVSLVEASSFAPLSAMGPVPRRMENALLITGIAKGSFGFELEESNPSLVPEGEESAEPSALEQVQAILESSTGTDDELTEAAAGLDPRAMAAIRAFLDRLAASEAVCAIETDHHRFAFTDVGQVRTSFERLADDNLREEVVTLTGTFDGVLPGRRSFEFKPRGQQVIIGKISPTVQNPGEIISHVGEEVSIQLKRSRIGAGRPKYVLLSLPWNQSPPVGADEEE